MNIAGSRTNSKSN